MTRVCATARSDRLAHSPSAPTGCKERRGKEAVMTTVIQ
jgi:hypothetical protein